MAQTNVAKTVQFAKTMNLKPIEKHSSFYLMVENYAKLIEIKFVSKKVQFLDDDSVWWISIYNINNQCLRIDVILETNDDVWKSNCWSYSVSGTANNNKIVFDGRNVDKKLTSSSKNILNSKESFLELKLNMTLLLKPSDGNPLQKFRDITAQYKTIISNNKCILNESKYSDFVFIVQGKQFKVHKSILAAASPVFDKLFSADLIESRTNECDVKDMEPTIFQYLLSFIYSGELPENLHEGNTARILFAAAHRYQIGELVDVCKQVEHFKLSVENAEEMYKWAFTYDLDDIKMDAWNIIKFDILEICSSMVPMPSPDHIPLLIAKKKENDTHLMQYRLGRSELQLAVKEK